jgi:hypothetical protein
MFCIVGGCGHVLKRVINLDERIAAEILNISIKKGQVEG